MNTQFDISETLNLFESSLENAAEVLGDITPIVLDQFFKECPEAEAIFRTHGMGAKESLQASMVDWGLYCLMNWFERKQEIEIILFDAAKQHDFLKLDPKLTINLFNTLIDVIESTVAEDQIETKRLWSQIKKELNEALITAEQSAKF